MNQPTRSTSPFAGPDPATIPTGTLPLTARIVGIMAGVQALYDQVATPGVQLHEAHLAADGLSVTLTVDSIEALSSWYAAYPRCSVSMSSRQVRGEDGHLYGLGGLDWMLGLGPIRGGGVRVFVRTVTVEQQVLPDTALVRAMFPARLRVQEAQAREIAHHAHRPGVAA
ncbi:hypothetical protein [Kitasatospora sp. CB01950]|uniref:hypothetical protein n=1 Tax=Kitasatospora sp. CB01950 TaxID=1703930 RepID=UPI00093B367A|nr:hypothetical protein [Kitasatospora sp. CB01950]OKJ06799.1 hypothetical protein AMK19_23360 [Kitasatospora sp. CB01950]